MTICREDLGLPVVDPYDVHLYKDANSYAANIDKFAGDPIIGRVTWAQPQDDRLHINTEIVKGDNWGSVLRRLAHEYAHNVEIKLMGGMRPWSQWALEGFAEWVAAKVMDSLGWEPYASFLARTEKTIARDGEAPVLRLRQLEDSLAWLGQSLRSKGKARTYGLAFLAMHKLIEKKGAAAIAGYFRTSDFPSNFGVTWIQFDREFRNYISALVAARHGAAGAIPAANAPAWKIGFQWEYAVKGPGIDATYTSEISREQTFDGVPAYVLSVAESEYLHTKDALALAAHSSQGKTVAKNNPPVSVLSWPLTVGKEWRNKSAVENAEQNLSHTVEMETVVAGVEQVKVSAGVFEAFRIETYSSQTGELIFEQWYAPRVKWFVKVKDYRPEGVIEQELVSFKID